MTLAMALPAIEPPGPTASRPKMAVTSRKVSGRRASPVLQQLHPLTVSSVFHLMSETVPSSSALLSSPSFTN